jgi:hypothetical protein
MKISTPWRWKDQIGSDIRRQIAERYAKLFHQPKEPAD